MSDDYSIDIRPLKRFVKEKLSHDSVLRNILLGEDDRVSAMMLMARAKIWLQLLKIEETRAFGSNASNILPLRRS